MIALTMNKYDCYHQHRITRHASAMSQNAERYNFLNFAETVEYTAVTGLIAA